MTCRKGGWKDHDNGRVVCRSLELRTALGMMEDHNRLLAATESGSGLVNDAMRRRSVLVLSCVLVALLCVGKESRAEPPSLAPGPGGSVTSQRPASHDPPRAPIAEERARVVQREPAYREPVARGPASRPADQAPDGRTAPDQRPTTDAPGRRVAPQGKTAHEPTGLREHGPQKTMGPDPARPFPQRPEERPASAGRDAQRPAEPPGRPVAEQGKPAHEPPGLQKHGQKP